MTFFPYSDTKSHFFEKLTFPTLRQGSSLVVARPTSMKICPAGPEEVVVQNDMSRLTFSGKKRSFLRFWQCVEIHFFEKFTFATLRQGSSLVVARPTSMEICPGGPGEVVVQNDMSRLTFSGKKRSFLRFWQCVEIHFFLRNLHLLRSDRGRVWLWRDRQAWKFVRQARGKSSYRMTCRDWHSRAKKGHFWDSDNASKFIFLRNLHLLRSDRGRVWLWRDRQAWKFVREARGKSSYRMTCRDWHSRAKKGHFWDSDNASKFIFLRNLHLLRSDRGRVWLWRDRQAWKFVREARGKSSYRMTCRDWHSRAKKGHFWDSDNASKFIFLRNLHLLRSDRGRVWLWRDRQAWKFVREARGKSSYRMTCRDWHSRAKKGHFWDSDNASKFIFIEKFTFATLRQGSSLVVARPTSMEICPGGPGEVVVQNDMSRLTFSGKKRSFLRFWQCVEILFFWEIYICYAQTGVEFGCGATDKHANLSGRTGGSHFWEYRMTCRGKSSYSDWHSRAKKGHFWDSDNASKFIFLRNLQMITFRVRMGKKGHFEQIFFIINFLEFKSVIQQNLMTFGAFEKLFNYQNRVHYHIFKSFITFRLFVRLKK